MRLYWPRQEIIDGTWKAPAVKKVVDSKRIAPRSATGPQQVARLGRSRIKTILPRVIEWRNQRTNRGFGDSVCVQPAPAERVSEHADHVHFITVLPQGHVGFMASDQERDLFQDMHPHAHFSGSEEPVDVLAVSQRRLEDANLPEHLFAIDRAADPGGPAPAARVPGGLRRGRAYGTRARNP